LAHFFRGSVGHGDHRVVISKNHQRPS
jgi:hypothetical protein